MFLNVVIVVFESLWPKRKVCLWISTFYLLLLYMYLVGISQIVLCKTFLNYGLLFCSWHVCTGDCFYVCNWCHKVHRERSRQHRRNSERQLAQYGLLRIDFRMENGILKKKLFAYEANIFGQAFLPRQKSLTGNLHCVVRIIHQQ